MNLMPYSRSLFGRAEQAHLALVSGTFRKNTEAPAWRDGFTIRV